MPPQPDAVAGWVRGPTGGRITRCGLRGQERREPAPAGFRISALPHRIRGVAFPSPGRPGCGSTSNCYLFRPLTRAVQAWVDDHLPPDATWFCGAVVEHCYIGAIVEGAIADGMVVR